MPLASDWLRLAPSEPLGAEVAIVCEPAAIVETSGLVRQKGIEGLETTVDALIAKVGPPDASQGTSVIRLIWCFADSTELWLETPDRVIIESVRHKGKVIFKRAKKK